MTENRSRAFLACVLSLAASIAVLLLVWYLLRSCFGYLDHPDIGEAVKESIDGGSVFQPENVEKLQYAASLALFPPLALLLLALFQRLLARLDDRRLAIAYGAATVLAALAIACLAAMDFRADLFFLAKNALAVHPVITLLSFALTLALMAFYRFGVEPIPSRRPVKKAFGIGLLLASLFILLLMPARLILNFGTLGWYQVSRHFNAYFYSVSQVCSGKAVLIDLDDQYGLYPHFLEPLFRVIGLNTFTFFMVMALLLAISFLCFYFVLYKCVKDPIIRFLGTAAFLYYGYVFFQIIGDPYFQYFPHRILFPGLLLVLSYLNFTRGGKPLYYLTFIVASASILWNFETGAVVFITWMLSLFYRDLLRARGPGALKSIAKDALAGASILGGTFAVYLLYVRLRYGGFPHLPDLVSYQYYFYSLGFYMLPMDLVNPWNLVALVYMAGIVYAALALLARDDSIGPKMIFTLSILGAGVFSYYQGRSHHSVLLTVAYPALLLTVIFTDMLYERTIRGLSRRKIAPGEALLLLGMLFFIVTSAISLAQNSGLALTFAPASQNSSYLSGMIDRNTGFIASHVQPGESVLILSYYSGLYYAGTHTASPVKAPGICEILTKDDMDKVTGFMESGAAGSKVFLDTFFPGQYADNAYVIRPLLDNYTLMGTSADGNMMFYEKPPGGQDTARLPENPPAEPGDPGVVMDCSYDPSTHALLTPDKTFVAFEDGCTGAMYLNDSYTIEAVVQPGPNAPGAVMLGNYLEWYGYHGFVIRRDGTDPDEYTYTYGAGAEPVHALRFRLPGEKPDRLVITGDGRQVRAYVDGSLVSSCNSTLAVSNVAYPLVIGNGMYYDHPFNGTIYGLKIYYRSLSAAEIADKSRAAGI